MAKTKFYISLLCVLFFGFTLGFAADEWGRGRKQGNNISAVDSALGLLTQEVHLTREQTVRVKAILEDALARFEALRQEIHPRFMEVQKDVRAQLFDVLDAAQEAKFDELRRAIRARHKRRFINGNPPAATFFAGDEYDTKKE